MHLLVACNGPNTIFFEPYNRSGVPKLYVIRIRIRQELFAERIDVQARNCVFLSIVLSELHSVLLYQPACATGTSATETSRSSSCESSSKACAWPTCTIVP